MKKKRDSQFLDKIKTITFGTGAQPPPKKKKKKFDPAAEIKKAEDREDPAYDHQVKVVGKLPLECVECGTEAIGYVARIKRIRKKNPNEQSLSA